MNRSQNIKSEGDDLIAAQAFVSSAKPHIDILSNVSRLDHKKAQSAILALKRGADPIFARAISRVCDQTLTLIGDSAPQPKIDSGLMTLQKLVSQYSQGLDEVLTDEHAQVKTSEPMIQAPAQLGLVSQANIDVMTKPNAGRVKSASNRNQRHNPPVKHEPLTPDDIDILSSAHKSAAATLKPLIVMVKTVGRKRALKNITKPIETSQTLIKDTYPSFETIMPSVINSILSDARQLGKNVSVSYLVGDTHIPKTQIEKIESCTKELGRCLVKYSLEAPEARLSRGESLTGQISVTVQASTEGMEIVISCTGTELPIFVKDRIETGSNAFEISYSYKEGRSTLSLYVAQSVLESQGKDDDVELVSKAPKLPLSREVRPMQELSL